MTFQGIHWLMRFDCVNVNLLSTIMSHLWHFLLEETKNVTNLTLSPLNSSNDSKLVHLNPSNSSEIKTLALFSKKSDWIEYKGQCPVMAARQHFLKIFQAMRNLPNTWELHRETCPGFCGDTCQLEKIVLHLNQISTGTFLLGGR